MRKILLPVIENFPLFVISMLLFGGLDVIYHQYLFSENEWGAILTAYGEITLMSYLVCIAAYLLRKIHPKVLFYIVLLAVYITNFYLRYAFTTDISPKIVLLLFETNSKEVSGFFRTYFMTPAMYKTVAVLAVLLILIIVGERLRSWISVVMDKTAGRLAIATILLFGVIVGASAVPRYWRLLGCADSYQAERWLMDIPFRKRMPIPNLSYSLQAIRLSGQDLYHMINATKASLDDVGCEETDSLNIILVIGESYNKHHASLYGYYLDTTPAMCAEADRGNLYAFNRVKAPHNMTSIVLKNVLCCNDVHEDEKWCYSPYFPAIFKQAGYDVWFWDNQYKWDPDAAWAFTLNSILFNDEIKRLSYTAVNDEGATYDGGLVSNFERTVMKKTGPRNLIVFHLGGQHFLASTQYPHEPAYEVFSAKDVKDTADYLTDESRQRIAEYANATRYNDSVIRQMMDLVRETNAVLIYFPDHGEEIYDYRDFYGRQLLGEDQVTPELIEHQIEIPFIVWCSDKWKLSHEAEWEAVGKAVDREFSTDNICHMLFRLAGIRTREYKAERDLLSPAFKPQTKPYNMLAL